MDAFAVQTDNLIDGFGSGNVAPESFSLDDDMSQYERDYLADLLKADVMKSVSVGIHNRLVIIDRFRLCRQQGRSMTCPDCAVRFILVSTAKIRLCDTCARILS